MNVVDLEGNEIDWRPKENICQYRSHGHVEAVHILKQLFPTCKILNEVAIPVHPHRYKYLDLYIPLLHIAIEVQGVQHYKHTPFFQKFKMDFYRQKKRDREKKEWCKLNNIILIELPYDRIKEWKIMIQEQLQ